MRILLTYVFILKNKLKDVWIFQGSAAVIQVFPPAPQCQAEASTDPPPSAIMCIKALNLNPIPLIPQILKQ